MRGPHLFAAVALLATLVNVTPQAVQAAGPVTIRDPALAAGVVITDIVPSA